MSDVRVILYDNTENSIKEWFWRRYVQVRRGWKKIGVSSWDDAYEKVLGAVRPGTRLMELQWWGDGSPGAPRINGKTPPDDFWQPLSTLVTPDSLVWFRMCSVLFGRKGQSFAERTADELACRVAGHTRVIGVWQSGLCSVRPGVIQPFFPLDGYRWKEEDWQKNTSGWREPRTIFCARMSVPGGW
jgi:hypothetical protein